MQIKILDNFLGKIGLARKKTFELPLSSGAGSSSIFGGISRAAKASLFINNKNWAFACIKARAEAVGNIKLKLFEVGKDGTAQEIFDHELLDLLASVNPFTTQFELFEATESHLDIAGNSFWLLDGVDADGNKTKPTAIYPLNPKYVEIKKGKLPNFIEEYKYTVDSVVKSFSPSQILHFRQFNADDPYKGIGILESIADWIDADNFATEYNRYFFSNAARPDATLETEGVLTEEQLKFLRNSFEEVYKGVKNSHKVAVLPKGVKFSPVGWNQKEMDFVEMARMARDKILAGFRVPKTILGLTEDVNRANAEASNYVFALRVVKPQMQRIVSYLNEFLVPRYGDNLYLDFEDPVPENRELELTSNEKALGAAAYASVNEIREREGLPPIENGDSVMTNFSAIPLGKPAAKKATPKVKNKNQIKPSVRFSKNLRKRNEIASLLAKEAVKALSENFKKIDEEKWDTAYKAFAARVEPFEKIIKETIIKLNGEQQERVIKNLAKKEKGKFDYLMDMDSEISVFIDGLTPILNDLFNKEGTETLALIGMADAFEANLERAAETLSRAIELMAENYNETTLALLKEKLQAGIDAGESLTQLADRVSGVYEFSDDVRSLRVAQSESFRVANLATREAWKQSKVVKTLKWYTATDERVCDYCGPMHNKTVGIDDIWFEKGESLDGKDGQKLDLDYSDIETPPLHANCRCYIRPDEISV